MFAFLSRKKRAVHPTAKPSASTTGGAEVAPVDAGAQERINPLASLLEGPQEPATPAPVDPAGSTQGRGGPPGGSGGYAQYMVPGQEGRGGSGGSGGYAQYMVPGQVDTAGYVPFYEAGLTAPPPGAVPAIADTGQTIPGDGPTEAPPKERVKYRELRAVADRYKGEDEDSSSFVDMVYGLTLAGYLLQQRLVPSELSLPQVRGLIDSGALPEPAASVAADPGVRQGLLVEAMGWSPEEAARSDAGTVTAYVRDEDERAAYELAGGATLRQGGVPFDTTSPEPLYSKFSGKGWGIYVMAADGTLYAGSHKVGLFHHSSFLAGSQTAAAGEIQARSGKLTGITNKSGHYRPGPQQMAQVLEELRSRGTSLAGVRMTLLSDVGRETHDAALWLRDYQQR